MVNDFQTSGYQTTMEQKSINDYRLCPLHNMSCNEYSLRHGMTAEMNVALLLPFPASNKKFPAFSVWSWPGFCLCGVLRRFCVKIEIILKPYKIVCIGLVAKNRGIYN